MAPLIHEWWKGRNGRGYWRTISGGQVSSTGGQAYARVRDAARAARRRAKKDGGKVRERVLALLLLGLVFAAGSIAPACAAQRGRPVPAGPAAAPARVEALQVELQTTGARAQSWTIHPGWNYLDRSLGVHWWRNGTLEELRFSNGVAGKQGGGFFFDSLVVRSRDKVTPLVIRPGEAVQSGAYTVAAGGAHWWPPRAVLSRRFVLGEDGRIDVRQVSRELVPTGTPFGPFAAKWAGIGASREVRLRISLATGRADPSVDMIFQGVGVWHPADDQIGYAHGGRGLEPSPGYCQSFVYHALLADAMRERNNVDLLDAATGEPIANPDGVNLADFSNSLLRYGREWALETKVDAWYSTWGPKSWNAGTSPERAALVAFQLIDGEHYERAVRDDVAAANLWADPLCAFNLKVSCLRAMEAWPASRLDAAKAPGILGREFGWVCWTVAATRELAARGTVPVTRAQLAGLDSWLAKAAGVLVRCQTPAGTWQCTPHPWPNWSPAPQSYGVPADRGLGQSHEHGILAAGAFAVWRQLPEGRARDSLADAIMRAADVWMRVDAPSPLHWLVGKKAGAFTPEVSETWGGPDWVYLWSAATWANRVAPSRRPSGLARFFGASDPSEKYLRALLRKSALTPEKFVSTMSADGTYMSWNLDAAVDMQLAVLAGWKP